MNRRTTRLGRVSSGYVIISNWFHIWKPPNQDASLIHLQLKSARKKTILAHKPLWPLLPFIEATCSDDETDNEQSSVLSSSPGETASIIVRDLAWRSEQLADVGKRLDNSQSRLKQSLTANTTSSPRGRRSRPRLRSKKAPPSRIMAPENLPKDCYSKDFLDSLTSKEKAQLNIDPKPILPGILLALDSLGF